MLQQLYFMTDRNATRTTVQSYVVQQPRLGPGLAVRCVRCTAVHLQSVPLYDAAAVKCT
jgi:hypothetical protein